MANEWVTGVALQTVIALRGFQRGDLIKCPRCSEPHTFAEWSDVPEMIRVFTRSDATRPGAMDVDEIRGWKPNAKRS